MAEVLRFENVSVRRGGATILSNLTWTVNEDERWVILGPNGAGKTTVVQLAAARMYPTTGNAWVLGERLGAVDITELRTRVGLASAALAERIDPAEKALDIVMSAAWGMTGRWRESYDDEDEARAQALLDVFGVGRFANRRFATLSDGEKKRVQVARALMTDPELLVLDEPASGLDLAGRELLLGALTELATDPVGPIPLLVTHHVEEIPVGYTHGLFLSGGKMVAAGPLEMSMNSETLTATFGIDLVVDAREGRYMARAATSAR